MKVLVVSGASGGHIFPAISFIEALKERDNQIVTQLVLPQRSSSFCNLSAHYNARYICSPKLTLSINSRNLIALLQLPEVFLQNLKIILEFKPDLVVGFGSLDSIPLLLLAWFFRIRTLIHEQNVIPGKANRLLAKFVDQVAISFEQSREYLHINLQRVILTGNPIRKELVRIDKSRAREFFSLHKDKLTILVTGGSQGSQHINYAFSDCVISILGLVDFQVIHICGSKDYEMLGKKYKDFNSKIKLMPFLDKMQYAYSAADLAITRAGATTVAELIYFNLPALVVPYPFAYVHQYENAKILQKDCLALIINDKELDTSKLKELLISLLKDPEKINSMRSKEKHISGGSAAQILAKLAVSLI